MKYHYKLFLFTHKHTHTHHLIRYNNNPSIGDLLNHILAIVGNFTPRHALEYLQQHCPLKLHPGNIEMSATAEWTSDCGAFPGRSYTAHAEWEHEGPGRAIPNNIDEFHKQGANEYVRVLSTLNSKLGE